MNKKLIICIIAVVIMVVGAIMAYTMGFNKGLEYNSYTRFLVYMNKESNLDDVRELVKEVYNGEFDVSYIDEFKDTISIRAHDISDEQIETLKTKLKEKYEFENVDENIVTFNTASVGTFELVKDYIVPFAIIFFVVMIYFAFAFKKLGWLNGLVIPAITIIIINALYVSIIAICRIPINLLTVPVGVFVYIISLLGVTVYLSEKNKAEA